MIAVLFPFEESARQNRSGRIIVPEADYRSLAVWAVSGILRKRLDCA